MDNIDSFNHPKSSKNNFLKTDSFNKTSGGKNFLNKNKIMTKGFGSTK